ncbi:thioesterase II family protein [Dactylosporangium sp. NPDC051541]|uniref:thioesterase II family protein n=1 Tax=Dactylosporangium sp. NPDC051541 TaxID=3363977 RepID=UPI00379FE442
MTIATNPTADAWLRRYHPHDDAPVRLVCFPHAGSSAPYFLPMAAGLSAAVDVLSVQYPGRQERRHEPLIDNVDTLADRCTEVLRPALDRPFALFGHSLGATVAFEVARRLEAEARGPVHLFASGRRAPSRNRDESVHRRDDDGIIAEMRSLSGTDTRVFAEEELLRMVLPILRNDYKAAETYEYRDGPLLRCPITVLTGHDDPKVSVEEAEAWREHTAGRSVLHVYGGGHFFLAEHISAVLALVGASLRAA